MIGRISISSGLTQMTLEMQKFTFNELRMVGTM